VMPLVGGRLPLPGVRLSKYLPAEGQRGQARLEAFPQGQVYNFSKGSQVHILTAAVAD